MATTASQYHVVERTSRLEVPAAEAFAWHERPGALERLTPPWERVEVLERTGGIEEGARTVLRVRAGPLSFRWVAQHREYVPGRQFVDEQVEGPFAYWRHLHLIAPDGPSACRLTDRVEYSPPAGTLGAAAAMWLARPRVERMLEYRHTLLAADLASHRRYGDRPRLRIAITGASGLLGSSLGPFLTTGGHQVVPVSRQRRGGGGVRWDPSAGTIDAAGLEGLDAVIHLAGENVGARWTDGRMRRIRESRVNGTRLLAETLAGLERPPAVLLSASGVGIYGDRGDETLTEDSSGPGTDRDFLAGVGRDWEAATRPARAAGIRVVLLRSGAILTPAGGALGRMLPPFRLGMGGPLGSGRQWLSWIAIDDAADVIYHALMNDQLAGPVNVTAPEPVTSRTFAATLGRVLGRPAILPVPAAMLRFLFGEMADSVLLASQRAVPARLAASGYEFRFSRLEPALRHLLGR